MKFRLNEELLIEATLTAIVNNINMSLAPIGVRILYIDNDKKFVLCRTPLGNDFCIPIEEDSRYASRDYKKLRYSGNGTVSNGEIYDSSGNHLGRAYYGLPTSHQHLDYNPNVYQYNRNNWRSGSPKDFNSFVNDVMAGRC